MTGLCVDVQRVASTPRDVPQVAHQGALVSVLDLHIRVVAAPEVGREGRDS